MRTPITKELINIAFYYVLANDTARDGAKSSVIENVVNINRQYLSSSVRHPHIWVMTLFKIQIF